MSETNINIYFNGEGNTQTGTATDPSPEENPIPNKNDPSKAKGGLKQIAGLATMAQLGKNALNYAQTHVQMYTGSSDMQDKVNAAGSLIGTGISIAANPALGIATAAFNLATKALDYAYKKKEESINLQQLRRRAGPSLNRSRLE